ncbi:MAG TPA: transketolase [Vicinamibacterales bacterium]|nr:transketolase [Vicinamibacterales bacterium]
MPVETSPVLPALKNIATRLRIESIRATTESGSGHPSTCASAADIVAALFFSEMRFDPQHPQHPLADRFVLSKGHAAPLLYAAWAEAGFIPHEALTHLREFTSDLEGHPTPRLPFVDVATGSLGQGLGAGVGIALNARRLGSDYRTYVLMGDGETAEGSVWEAASMAVFHKLDSLVAIVDVNALGQSRETQLAHDMTRHEARWQGFGWHTVTIDGHDMQQIVDALAGARKSTGIPTAILAKTSKGHGVSFMSGKPNWHGKAIKKGDEFDRAVKELEGQLVPEERAAQIRKPAAAPKEETWQEAAAPSYKLGDLVATREAYGTGLASLGSADPRVVALDADVKNSTFSERFEAVHPDRFYQCFIAEQGMIGAAMGLAARGAIPYPSTFAAFLTRAADFVRMAAISNLNIKMAGSHAGVSIGEDGPSQMALEDLSMMTSQPNIAVLYPSDAVCAERLIVAAAYHEGPVYIRTSRPKLPVIYDNSEQFTVGGCKVLRSSSADTATVIGAGVTLYEALKAYDELKKSGVSIRVIDLYSLQPIDAATLITAGKETRRLITVEDHYLAGGIGDAVARAVAPAGLTVTRLAVTQIPRSGKPDELLDKYGISARHIVAAVQG